MIVIRSLTNIIYCYILEYIIRSAVSFQSKLHIIILNYEFYQFIRQKNITSLIEKLNYIV